MASLRFAAVVSVLALVSCSSSAPPASEPGSTLKLSVHAGKESVELELNRNDHLFAPGFQSEVWENGVLRVATAVELPLERDCYFQGRARTSDGRVGIAAIDTCAPNGAPRGFVQVGDAWLRLEPDATGHVHASRLAGSTVAALGEALVRRLQPETIRSAAQALTAPSKYLELTALSDHFAYDALKGRTLQNVADMVNAADALIRNGQLSPVVQISLARHITFMTQEPWSESAILDGDATLSAMGSWMAQTGSPKVDEVFLFTGADLAVSNGQVPPTYNTAAVGYATIGAVCGPSAHGIVEVNSPVVGYRGMVLAHELGHTFSLQHDATSGYIMAPSAGEQGYPTTWSSTSVSQWSTFFSSDYGSSSNPACLENLPQPFGTVCGDGVVGSGEQCDCGSSDCSTLDPCCNGATCQFEAGAQCSANDGCCQSCQVVAAGTVCHGAATCQAEATCNGISGQCPENDSPSGTTCTSPASTSGECYVGSCVSLQDQCDALEAGVGYALYVPSPLATGNAACQTLFCNSAPNQPPNTYWSIQTKDGSWCGNGMQCLAGACVSSATLPMDQCPEDPDKTEAGTCGCGVSEQDGDHDGVPDCVDGCPSNPERSSPPCTVSDAGTATDAGTGTDAGTAGDAGTMTDAGTSSDAGTATDAGTVRDAGTTSDAGAVVSDGGTQSHGGDATPDGTGGCSTAGSSAASLPLGLLLAALALGRRRRATR